MAKQIFLPVRSDSEIVSTIISVLPGSAACLHENVGMQDVLGACMADLLLGFGQLLCGGLLVTGEVSFLASPAKHCASDEQADSKDRAEKT